MSKLIIILGWIIVLAGLWNFARWDVNNIPYREGVLTYLVLLAGSALAILGLWIDHRTEAK